jgi:hypothetical protein
MKGMAGIGASGVGFLLLGLFSACVAIDQVLPPLQKPASPTAAGESQLCEAFDFTSTLDVDAAYIRAVREFGFTPIEEIEREAKRTGRFLLPPGLKHNKTPGVMYNLAQGVRLIFHDLLVRPWFNMDILKIQGGRSRIAGDFCYTPRQGVGDVRPAIFGFTQNAFKP